MFDANLSEIKLESVTKYLKLKDWKHDNDFPNKKMLLFKKVYKDEVFTVTIPSNDEFSDYKRRLVNLIDCLSDIENIPTDKIINELQSINNNKQKISIPKGAHDRLSFRIISEESEDGSLPLAYSEVVISGIKKLILSAMYSEKNSPVPVVNTNFKNLYSELNQYKLAQTNVGSYIFNIDISLEDSQYMQLGFDMDSDDNYATTRSRKIIRRIQNGIADICDNSINSYDLKELSLNGYKKGLNANMCDAILEFKKISSDVCIESSVQWSDVLPAPNNVKDKVKISHNDFIIFETLSNKYKESELEEITTDGIIIELFNSFSDGEKSISKRPQRYITIASIINNSINKIRIHLEEKDYILACKAHSKNSTVTVTGEVKKRSNYLEINKYSNFLIL
ncbi:hypothetical protein [uncultured Clostridium sp.]|uniref:hypothetical protein n=1 Tax=uncultured Clostridium sp. TaxID=59620 RepID=UPI00261638CE|nr:hypothetical protein [uncultured Clostridium sp.]